MKMPQKLRESISRLQFTGHIMQNSLQMFPHNNLCLQSVRKKRVHTYFWKSDLCDCKHVASSISVFAGGCKQRAYLEILEKIWSGDNMGP